MSTERKRECAMVQPVYRTATPARPEPRQPDLKKKDESK